MCKLPTHPDCHVGKLRVSTSIATAVDEQIKQNRALSRPQPLHKQKPMAVIPNRTKGLEKQDSASGFQLSWRLLHLNGTIAARNFPDVSSDAFSSSFTRGNLGSCAWLEKHCIAAPALPTIPMGIAM